MNAPLTLTRSEDSLYPDSDGNLMADNTKQYQWIVTIQGNLDKWFVNEADVFVAGDLLWYAVEGKPTIRVAPDVMVVFGRPKGHRGSYRQWLEDNIAPQVVFEIWSPGNRPVDLLHKVTFYERYGVEEFYFYDPDNNTLSGYLRQEGALQQILNMDGWVSPRLKIRFVIENDDLVLYFPNGQRFLTFVEWALQKEQETKRAEEAIQQKQEAMQQKDEAIQQKQQAIQQKQEAIKLAEQERQRAETAEADLARLRALLEKKQANS